jgi:hypothetical protein
MRMMRTMSVSLALTCALGLVPGLALAKSDNAKGPKDDPAGASADHGSPNGNGIGKGGVPALRDRLLGLIDALDERIDRLRNRVSELEDGQAATDARVGALEEDVSDLDSRLEALEGQFSDDDGDSFSEVQDDCDDSDAGVNPLASEIPANGIDDDCDHLVDEA